MTFTVLIIEDDLIHAKLLAKICHDEQLDTLICHDLASAQTELTHCDAILTDLRLPDGESIDLIRACKANTPDKPIILITGYATAQNTREAFHLGVVDVLLKPLELELTRLAIRRLSNDLTQRSKIERLSELVQDNATDFVCHTDSPVMQQTLQLAMRVTHTDLPILLTGESGVGKSLLAQHIHKNSPRKQHPFFTINCATLPHNTLEAELFGYEKGAFTGATQRKQGLLELAENGTLFLDEINSASLDTQTRLLQFIQEKTCMRLGATHTIAVNTRLIFATNQDLLNAVKEGKFREDLYFRIQTFPIAIPPLRERKEDIPRLVIYLIQKHRKQLNERVTNISPAAIKRLQAHNWPGNVRELESHIQRALIMCNHDTLTEQDFHLIATPSASNQTLPWAEDADLATVTQRWIEITLERCAGNKSKAAKQLGIDPATLWRKSKKKEGN